MATARDEGFDVVDEGSDLSFPASDPPAWMGSTAHAAPSSATTTDLASRVQAVDHRRSYNRAAVIAFAACGVVVLFVLAFRSRR